MQRKSDCQNCRSRRAFPIVIAVPAMAILAFAGCRNTTNSPIYPASAGTPLGPLAPVQGSATLSPIQPTSGFSTLGAPTRVPPPPTGSFSNSNGGATSNYAVPPSTYAPNRFQTSGATIGSTGMTQGVTELNPLPNPGLQPSGSGVRQTGWVGENGASPVNQGGVAPIGNAPAPIVPTNPRNGGMQVIDLTGAPYPPGYVPPQNRPGVQNFGVQNFPSNAPYPQIAPANSLQPLPQVNAPVSPQPIQPDPSRFARSAAALPSTEPFPSAGASPNQQLQWRRPSPRF